MPSTRQGNERYTKRENDLATLGEVQDLINQALNRLVARRIVPLEVPWYVRLWRKVKRETR